MNDTACAAAAAATPAIDDPLADPAAPNPAALVALGGALELAEEAHVFDLAGALADPGRGDLVSALLCHELAACHRLMMRFGAMADDHLSHTSPTIDADRRQVGRDAIGFAAIAARLMSPYRQGALTLPKLRADGGTKRIIVDWGCLRPAHRGRGRQPPPGLDDRARPRDLRWTWGGSLGFAAAAGRCRDGGQTLRAGHFPAVTPAKAGAHIPEA